MSTKFEAGSNKKVIRGPKEIRSHDSGHLGVVLWSLRREALSSVPNLKQIALFVQKVIRVQRFRNWII